MFRPFPIHDGDCVAHVQAWGRYMLPRVVGSTEHDGSIVVPPAVYDWLFPREHREAATEPFFDTAPLPELPRGYWSNLPR